MDRGRRQGAEVQITPRTSRGLEKRVEGALRGELLQRGYKRCKGKKMEGHKTWLRVPWGIGLSFGRHQMQKHALQKESL